MGEVVHFYQYQSDVFLSHYLKRSNAEGYHVNDKIQVQ